MLTIGKLSDSLRAMGRKEIFTGIFVILVILGVIFGIKKAKAPKVQPFTIPTPTVTQELESKFKLSIPDNVEKINLQAASGFEGIGIATRKFESGIFTQMIIADLPDPESGNYQVWLIKDDNTKISTGTLKLAKGGYLLEFSSEKNYSDYKKVEVKLEDKVVLTGSF